MRTCFIPTLGILLSLNIAVTAQENFGKYRKVDAYEIRPGILMMPRYTADNQVCEIGIERLQYSPPMTSVIFELSEGDIDSIFDELVPAVERGKRTNPDGIGDLVDRQGSFLNRNMDYANVSIDISEAVLPSKHKKEINGYIVVARIKWKNRVCKE